jgi:GAF domain-containing protein
VGPRSQGIEGDLDELLDTATTDAEPGGPFERLAAEQAALRRIATLVAAAAAPDELFAKVAEETAGLLGQAMSALHRDEGDGTLSIVALWGPGVAERVLLGRRIPLDGDATSAQAIREGRPVRNRPYRGRSGSITEQMYELGVRASVGCPIVVNGSTWGAVVVASLEGEPYPPANSEERLLEVADLLAIAIANAESREALTRLADEQAALRRVATLVAHGAASTKVFDAVANEVGTLLETDNTVVARFEADGSATAIGSWGTSGAGVPTGTRATPGGRNVMTIVAET